MSPPELVIFGRLTIDNVVTATGEVLPQSFGGNAVYAALGARIWSDRVGVVSRCGRKYPRACFRLLSGLGIDIGGIRVRDVPHQMNIAFAYNDDGSRTRIIPGYVLDRMTENDRARFYDISTLPDAEEILLEFSPDGNDMPEAWWDGVAGIHCPSILMQRQLHIARTARAKSRNRALWVAIDSPWHDSLNTSHRDATGLLELIDLLLPSEQDFENYRQGVSRDTVAFGLIAEGARAIALKRGSSGSRIFQRGFPHAVDIPAFPVQAVDPTGAGDAFCGGFLAGVRLTGDLLAAAHYGTVSASFAVERRGIEGLVAADRAEAVSRLNTLAERTGIPVIPRKNEASAC